MFLRERLFRSNGIWTYSVSRITDGTKISTVADRIVRSVLSSARATPFSRSMTARRTVHTLIGSYDALSTRTRVVILTGNLIETRLGLSKRSFYRLWSLITRRQPAVSQSFF